MRNVISFKSLVCDGIPSPALFSNGSSLNGEIIAIKARRYCFLFKGMNYSEECNFKIIFGQFLAFSLYPLSLQTIINCTLYNVTYIPMVSR